MRRVIASVENETAQFVEIYFEQANVFSALVGIFAARAFSSLTVYEKPRHADLAQQRFPDLKLRGSSDPPSAGDALEIKASLRPWALQAHYNHAGWYCVFRYLIDPKGAIDPGRNVLIWRVHLAFLQTPTGNTRGAIPATAEAGALTLSALSNRRQGFGMLPCTIVRT